MKTARRQDCRYIDYSAVRGDGQTQLIRQVVRFVHGINGERESPVTDKQIKAWFSATPDPFIVNAISHAFCVGFIRKVPNKTASTGQMKTLTHYEITAAGHEFLVPGSTKLDEDDLKLLDDWDVIEYGPDPKKGPVKGNA